VTPRPPPPPGATRIAALGRYAHTALTAWSVPRGGGAEVVLDFRVGSGTPGLVRLGPRDRLWIWGGVSATSWGRYEVLWAASSGRLADELGERDAPVVVFRVEWDDGRDDVLDPGLEEIRAAIAAIADAAGCAFEGLNP
jgi:hypothetical protein